VAVTYPYDLDVVKQHMAFLAFLPPEHPTRDKRPVFELTTFTKAVFDGQLIVPSERYGKVLSGWYEPPWDALAFGVSRFRRISAYATVNPTNRALLARAKAIKAVNSRTADKNVPYVNNTLFDFDPKREVADISATEAERRAALERRDAFLGDHPDLLSSCEFGSSGNGAFLVVKLIGYRNDGDGGETERLSKEVYGRLAEIYSDNLVEFDRTTCNPSRLGPLPGTFKCKGENHISDDESESRPWRMATIDGAPRGDPVPLDLVSFRDRLPVVPKAVVAMPLKAPPPAGAPRPKTLAPRGKGVSAYGAAALAGEVARVASAAEGNRNETLNLSAFAVGQLVGAGAVDRGEAAAELAEAAGAVGLGDREIAATLASGLTAGEKEPRDLSHVGNGCAAPPRAGREEGDADGRAAAEDLAARLGVDPRQVVFDEHMTDTGNGRRFVHYFGDQVRYCHPAGKWLVWDGRRWRWDCTGRAMHLAKIVARLIGVEAALTPGRDRRKQLMDWSLDSESVRSLRAMLVAAQSEPRIPVQPDELDSNIWLLNCPNGTVDLLTRELREHRREDMITCLSPVAYDRDAAAPTWEKTVAEVFDRNVNLAGYWQRFCGLCLTGDVSEQILPIAHGRGANGKSTLINAILDAMGPDYAMKAMPDLLMTKKHEAHPTERADLFGKRLVVAIETGEGARINETLVKELTGSDRIRARRMREDPWEFSPSHKVLLCTNHRPVVKGTDHAIWRRLRLIPFNVTFADDQQDKSLPDKLREESPGILRWCVEGCKLWRSDGLQPPKEVVEATADYRHSEDVLGRFLEDECMHSPSLRAKATPLYQRYRRWAEACGEVPVNQNRFGAAMTERDFPRTTSNGIWYEGIGLRADGPSEN
jgi:P4 family phage/plasmid primase-like protien